MLAYPWAVFPCTKRGGLVRISVEAAGHLGAPPALPAHMQRERNSLTGSPTPRGPGFSLLELLGDALPERARCGS